MERKTGMIVAGVGAASLLLWWTMRSASASQCKTPLKDAAGHKSTRSGDCARAGVASNPAYRWTYQVQEGDSPTRITKHFLGTDNRKPVSPTSSATTAYVELMDENPQQGVTNNIGPEAAANARLNPWTTGYNFASLMPGDVLNIPSAWNAYIDEQGNARGQLAPFPTG